MKEKKFLDTVSDDIIMIEDAYKLYLEKNQNIPPPWVWSSLCRVYTMMAILEIEFFIEDVMEKTEIEGDSWKKKIEEIVKKSLNRSNVPRELMIPEKIDKFICLRELRHYIIHTDINDKTIECLRRLGLTTDIEKYGEKEFKIIKKVRTDMINLIGMSNALL